MNTETLQKTHSAMNYVVLGATGSVGSALASQLRDSGHHVFLGGRNRDLLGSLSTSLGCRSAEIQASDASSIDNCLKSAAEVMGRIDGVANCIGSVLLKPAQSTTDDEWHETLTTNLFSAFAVVRSATVLMRQSGGSIVLISSAAASIGLPNHEAIAAAKAGIIGLTLSAAASSAARGIRVNAVAPGLVKSGMTSKIWQNPAAAATSAEMHALGRLGEPDDIAAAIRWLLSPESSWVTGQTIGVDGGLSSLLPRAKARG